MSRPDDRPTETPTTDRERAADEGAWMARNWLAVAAVSILALVVLALGLLQYTGLVNLFAPIAGTEAGQWAAFAVIALVVAGVAAWSWAALVGDAGS